MGLAQWGMNIHQRLEKGLPLARVKTTERCRQAPDGSAGPSDDTARAGGRAGLGAASVEVDKRAHEPGTELLAPDPLKGRPTGTTAV